MSCNKYNKVKITCGTITQSSCVEWEIPEDLQAFAVGGSSVDPIECTTLDESLEDIYTKLQELEEVVDFSGFESSCLELDDEPTLQTIITALDEKVCELAESVDGLTICSLLDEDVTECEGLDFSCLENTDECDNPIVITSFKSLIQVLIDKVCALEAAE